MHSIIAFDQRRKRFTIDGKAVPGAHPTLKRCFYNTYSYAVSRTIASVATPHERHNYYGMQAGIKLDTTITRSVELYSRTGVVPKMSRMSGNLKKFWWMCMNRNWQPVSSQVPVGSSIYKVATAVDVVCKDNSGNIVLLEVKLGYSYNREGNAMMKHPYIHRRNSPLNQHYLQVLLTRELYRCTYPNQLISQCYICRFESEFVDTYPLPSWVTDTTSEFLRVIQYRHMQR